jgi:hypothetical protein
MRGFLLICVLLIGCVSRPSTSFCSLPELEESVVSSVARAYLRRHNVLKEEWILTWESRVQSIDCAYEYETAERLDTFDPGVSVIVNRHGEVEELLSNY